jgi:Domain of unknown function (DUF4783)
MQMKRILLAIILIPLLSFTGIDDIIAALKEGNSGKMAQYFDNTVEVTMPNKSDSYSKGQAEMIIKDFFSSKGIKNFTVIHRGEKGDSQYCIGNLITRNGSFRTTIYLKQKGDRIVVQEISFENN